MHEPSSWRPGWIRRRVPFERKMDPVSKEIRPGSKGRKTPNRIVDHVIEPNPPFQVDEKGVSSLEGTLRFGETTRRFKQAVKENARCASMKTVAFRQDRGSRARFSTDGLLSNPPLHAPVPNRPCRFTWDAMLRGRFPFARPIEDVLKASTCHKSEKAAHSCLANIL